MKVFLRIFVLFVLFIPSISILAQDQDMMKAWQEYMTPGKMHKLLANNVGEWQCEITTWMDPSQPPMKSEGIAVTEAIFDGKYFQTKFSGSFMGMPYNGLGLDGYDNARKIFFTTWADNMGTGLMYLEGTYDEPTKTFTYKGTSFDPLGKEVNIRQVIKVVDKDNLISEMYNGQNGEEYKSMEMKYTRKK